MSGQTSLTVATSEQDTSDDLTAHLLNTLSPEQRRQYRVIRAYDPIPVFTPRTGYVPIEDADEHRDLDHERILRHRLQQAFPAESDGGASTSDGLPPEVAIPSRVPLAELAHIVSARTLRSSVFVNGRTLRVFRLALVSLSPLDGQIGSLPMQLRHPLGEIPLLDEDGEPREENPQKTYVGTPLPGPRELPLAPLPTIEDTPFARETPLSPLPLECGRTLGPVETALDGVTPAPDEIIDIPPREFTHLTPTEKDHPTDKDLPPPRYAPSYLAAEAEKLYELRTLAFLAGAFSQLPDEWGLRREPFLNSLTDETLSMIDSTIPDLAAAARGERSEPSPDTKQKATSERDESGGASGDSGDENSQAGLGDFS